MPAESTNPIEIFYSYSHEDEQLRKKLEIHLSTLKRQKLISGWHDRNITAGMDWEHEIDSHLNTAPIILLLISPDFIASDYCYGIEMTRAMERHKAGEALVIPIILRPADLKGTPFMKLQALPTNARPVTRWEDEDEAFLDVARGIRRAIEELVPNLSAGPSNDSQVWNVPFRRNPYFTGREDILTHLRNTLTSDKTAALTQPQAISGLGGIGKTQTAVEYAYRYREKYKYILWVKAETRETLISDFVTIAGLLNLREKDAKDSSVAVNAVKRWLETHTDWLLILDNADDLTMASDFLPPGDKGHILLTTRAQFMDTLAQPVEIEKMGLEEGTKFLLHRARILPLDAPIEAASAADRAAAQNIVQEMDGLPLALDQAGAYIEETRCGLSRYLEFYKKNRTELLKRRGGIAATHPPVASTWSLSFEKVEQANPAAADLLRLCAFLSPDAIPEEIFTEGASELGRTLGAVAADPMQLNTAIGELLKYSLIRRNPDQTLTIHRLVQAVLKDEMDRRTRRQWAVRAVRAVYQAFPDVTDYTTWNICEQYLPHAKICSNLIEQWKMEFLEAASLVHRMGYYLQERAQYTEAEPFYQQALNIKEKVLGQEHVDTGATLFDLAKLYQSQGNYEEAKHLYQQTLAIIEKLEGLEHWHTASTLHELASLAQAQGQYEEAKRLYQQALSIKEKTVGLEHPSTATTLHELARLAQAQGQYEEARRLYQQALSITEKLLPPYHPSIAATLYALASLYQSQNQYEEAEPLYQRALAIDEKVFGLEHPEVATDLEGYADLLWKMGRKNEAEKLEARAKAIRAKYAQKNPG